ncbi:acetyl-CoA synthetase-like protein [Aspergillus steynii IBT 23096]|uniref:Acetyl-CoA synthetase-like protein n=1 Tax=Aspergillus steynii IBT 23096 TaxID=1392250 RepID=A0A2I2GMF6_9EURO|nr:acetyl-CoA synthetase-like protein [Aspergillus steynii IBT 23096]PLB54029.1 acetyl-CoA synthetase-like protein [Aspergillus steynii IBT 23096]
MKPSVAEHFRHACHTTPVPTLIDELADLHPDQPIVSIPCDNHDVSAGYRDVTYGEFARAVNCAAWWIVETLGSASSSFAALHYVAPQDLSYMVFALAVVKTGYITLTCHPAAGLDTHISLIEKTNCQYLLHPAPGFPKAKTILSAKPHLKAIMTPTLDFWLSEPNTPQVYPYPKTLSEVLTTPFAAIHTSATTGAAKPIIMTHATLNQQAPMYLDAEDTGRVNFAHWRDQRVAFLAPMTIAAGFYTLFGLNMIYNLTIVLPVFGPGPVTASVTDGIIAHGNVTSVIVSPKYLRDTCANQSYLNRLRTLSHLVVVGAPCPLDIGPILRRYVPITYIYGSSEANVFPIHLTNDPGDWAYLKLDPVVPYEFRPVWREYHELVIHRSESDRGQSAFYMFPDMDEYPMKDLFRRHPDPQKVGLWRYCGRVEDLTESESVGRFLPRDMEVVIESCEGVKGAVVCEERGGGMPVFVEVDENAFADEREVLLERIWQWVEQANNISPVKGYIWRSSVIFVNRQRPLPRGVKGYPQRGVSKSLYRREIEEAYRTFGC